jgi:hypothetical protein
MCEFAEGLSRCMQIRIGHTDYTTEFQQCLVQKMRHWVKNQVCCLYAPATMAHIGKQLGRIEQTVQVIHIAIWTVQIHTCEFAEGLYHTCESIEGFSKCLQGRTICT